MSSHQEVNKLLNKLSENTPDRGKFGRFKHYLLPDFDVSAYQTANAWPGKEYILMGHSFNLEPENDKAARAEFLTRMFVTVREYGCMPLADALTSESFVEILSRFERDWMSRLPADTLIGPAFHINGSIIPEAIAVWRGVHALLSRSKRH